MGSNTLKIISENRDRFDVVGLACGRRSDLLWDQIKYHQPKSVSVGSSEVSDELEQMIERDSKSHPSLPETSLDFIGTGPIGHEELIVRTKPDIVIAAMSGTHSLQACLKAVELNISTLGIANKEVLVMAGDFVNEALKTSSTALIPVDSEHSAIFQCLMGNSSKFLKKIFLTASGGPFRNRDAKTFSSIRKEEALKHPNWSMGAKITIDSATMMNKALEFIEAIRLFHVKASQIEVMVHPESIVHSMVEYCDGSVMAQLGPSDMRLPIALALGYPERLSLDLDRSLDLTQLSRLHFEKPDESKFPALRLVHEALDAGPQGPVIFNAANEVAVEQFLNDEISFISIMKSVSEAMDIFGDSQVTDLSSVIALDEEVKAWARRISTVGKWSKSG